VARHRERWESAVEALRRVYRGAAKGQGSPELASAKESAIGSLRRLPEWQRRAAFQKVLRDG
jgi:hypothetical protein